jgi:hypothetical protein
MEVLSGIIIAVIFVYCVYCLFFKGAVEEME